MSLFWAEICTLQQENLESHTIQIATDFADLITDAELLIGKGHGDALE